MQVEWALSIVASDFEGNHELQMLLSCDVSQALNKGVGKVVRKKTSKNSEC